jgi:hypothetical protein
LISFSITAMGCTPLYHQNASLRARKSAALAGVGLERYVGGVDLAPSEGEPLRPISVNHQTAIFVCGYYTTKAGGCQGFFSPFSETLRFRQRGRALAIVGRV